MDTMTANKTTKARKLLFEFLPTDSPGQITSHGTIGKEQIKRLKQANVKTIYIISSRPVHRESYLRLIKTYEDSGFAVESLHIEKLDHDHLKFVNNAARDINLSFQKGSCQIISFGRSCAGTVISCFFVYTGDSAEDAIERVQNINKSLIGKEREISFVYDFQKLLRSHQYKETGRISVDEETDKTLEEDHAPDKIKGAVSITKETAPPEIEPEPEIIETKVKEEKKPSPPADEVIHEERRKKEPTQPVEEVIQKEKKKKKEKPQPPPKDISEKKVKVMEKEPPGVATLPGLKYGHFYSSIRFKLISIISFIIVVSLSGMIFLATYFFKTDNEIRVNENNLKISEVISLKVKSDFHSIIDKSKLLANAMMQNISEKDIERYSELILHNDRDFIFFGLAVASKKGAPLNFIKSSYNTSLMNESQISKKDIETINNANSKIFSRSLDGDTVIQNVSPGFKQPIIGLSLPFHKTSAGKVKSILVSYIKLDKFLSAFKDSGITKAFMVNEQGDIIAHPDSSIVASGGNYINIPIVKMMIKSTLNNGQTRYMDEQEIFHLGSFKKIGIAGCGVIATVEEDKAFQEIYNMQRRNIYLMIIVLTSVILIIYFFAKTLTTPIVRLVTATKKIKEGEFNVNIIPTTKDEIGELTSSFIEMGQGLEEREKMKDAFGKFVNPEIAEQVLKGEIRLGGERKTAAVFFSDIRSFTAISEKLEPEEVVEFLNDYMTRMVHCVNETDGVVDKYIGDAIMAEWGVPISKGNDTENAINAALMMRESLIDFNSGRGDEKKPIIKIGCGINTGAVLAGQIGSEDRMEYTVIGDAVNLASRIETLNKPFGTDILVSQDSLELVKDIFAVEKMSPIKVKGKEEPQQIYAVLGRMDDPGRPKTLEEMRERLGIDQQPFNRRWNDRKSDATVEEEVKYEILE